MLGPNQACFTKAPQVKKKGQLRVCRWDVVQYLLLSMFSKDRASLMSASALLACAQIDRGRVAILLLLQGTKGLTAALAGRKSNGAQEGSGRN